METKYIIIAVIVLIVLYLISTYNALTKLRAKVEESFSTMDVYLKKRFDLIPNVVETVKGYTKHERETLNELISLRAKSYSNQSIDEKMETSAKISQSINKLIAVAENYPDLKASENFRDLSAQLKRIEDEIANARKYYNATVRKYNTKTAVFPSNLVAKLFGFKPMRMFEATETERQTVKVSF